MPSNNVTTSGTYAWTSPTGLNNLIVELWGGGGGGGSANGTNATTGGAGGGGGGAYARITVTGLVAGNTYIYKVGAGGAGGAASSNLNGTAGTVSTFNNNTGGNTSTIVGANGGGAGLRANNTGNRAGAGGAANGTGGITSYKGGNGNNQNGAYGGGGAGAGAGNANVGTDAASITGATGTNGGGNGGNGGVRNAVGNVFRSASAAGGGGAGSANTTGRVGGAGGVGRAQLTWWLDYPLPSGAAGTFPTTGILDNFNRASLGADWTIDMGSPVITSNELDFAGEAQLHWKDNYNLPLEYYISITNLTADYQYYYIDYNVHGDPETTYRVSFSFATNIGVEDFQILKMISGGDYNAILSVGPLSWSSRASVKIGWSHLTDGTATLYIDRGSGWENMGSIVDTEASGSGFFRIYGSTDNANPHADNFGGGTSTLGGSTDWYKHAYLEGSASVVRTSVPAYLYGNSNVTTSKSAYLDSNTAGVSPAIIQAFFAVPNKAGTPVSSSKSAYLKGQYGQDSRHAFLYGAVSISTSKSSYLLESSYWPPSGTSTNHSAYLNGYEPYIPPNPAILVLDYDDTYTDQEPHSIITTASGTIYMAVVYKPWFSFYKSINNGLNWNLAANLSPGAAFPSGGSFNYARVAIDGNSKIHIVMTTSVATESQGMRYGIFDTTTDTMGTWETVYTQPYIDNWAVRTPSISIDASGIPHIVFSYLRNVAEVNRLAYATKVTGAWTWINIDPLDIQPWYYIATENIALDEDNIETILDTWSSEVIVRRKINGVWQDWYELTGYPTTITNFSSITIASGIVLRYTQTNDYGADSYDIFENGVKTGLYGEGNSQDSSVALVDNNLTILHFDQGQGMNPTHQGYASTRLSLASGQHWGSLYEINGYPRVIESSYRYQGQHGRINYAWYTTSEEPWKNRVWYSWYSYPVPGVTHRPAYLDVDYQRTHHAAYLTGNYGATSSQPAYLSGYTIAASGEFGPEIWTT